MRIGQGPHFSSPNQPDQERTTAYRASAGPDSWSAAYCATIVGDWEEPSGESRIQGSRLRSAPLRRHMSRSKHTRPRRVLAASRVRAPDEPRGRGDPSDRRTLFRELKELGIHAELATPVGEVAAPLPRVVCRRPRKGYHHAAAKADIQAILRFFGEQCTYGLRSVELVQGQNRRPEGRLLLGRLMVPGRIVLFDLAHPPWRIPGPLPEHDEERLARAGAVIQIDSGRSYVTVAWPDETLRDYMLFDVLMHEVGHHLIQQYKGKRTLRVARTKDHEAFADRFAYKCRVAYQRQRNVSA